MSIHNINNLQLNASYDLGQHGSAGRLGSGANSGVGSTGSAQRSGSSLGAQGGDHAVDWFSQLNASHAHPITLKEPSGEKPSIDSIVNAIMRDLGIQD